MNSNERITFFMRGFFAGLAAPSLLYKKPLLPSIPHIVPVFAPHDPITRLLASDWHKIGTDLDDVINRHAKNVAKKSIAKNQIGN